MKKLFINFSNHPSSKWSEKQLNAAKEMGEIVDYPFPAIDPTMSKTAIETMVEAYIVQFNELSKQTIGEDYLPNLTICIAGEMSFVMLFAIACFDCAANFDIVTATSERNTTLNDDGTKTVAFEFVQFREIW